MKNSILTSLFLFISLLAISQQVPTLICLDVDENGDVVLHWLPADISDLLSYDIYHFEGSYVKIGNVNSSTNNYLHVGAQTDLVSQQYYVEAVYSANNVQSNTLQTIFLQVGVSTDFNEATLYWDPLSNPLPEGSNSRYYIYKEYPPDNWNLIDSAASAPYKHTVFVCDDWINFRVELENSNGCVSRSNIRGGQFKDIILPDSPFFDSVSINYFNNTPRIVLGWTASLSQDVVGYIMYRQQGLSFFEFDTVYGINSTFYIDSLVEACDTIHKYAIASIDSCGNKSPGTFSNPLQNVHLIDVTYNPCLIQATITFEPFIDYDSDSIDFELIGNSSVGKGHFDKAKSISNYKYYSGSRSISDVITVVDDDLSIGRVYEYYIREIVYKGSKVYTSSSCIKSIYTYGYEKPTYSYFANADVLPNNDVELTIDFDTIVKNSFLQIWRSDPGDDFLKYLMTINVDTLTNSPLQIVDTSADGSEGFYRYGVKVMDSCGKKQLEPDRLKTIGLSAWIKNKNNNLLQWNFFEGWKAGVDKYFIYRMENAVEPTSPIDSVYWHEDEYTDDISSISGSVENLVYWVQAVERGDNEFGFREKSNSNRTIVIPESDIYFPNAFKPGGTDPFFKPVFRFLNGTNYLFQIYNRWGQLIFETKDPYNGWDGTYNGTYVQQGVYIYKFQYLDVYGNSTNEQGTVTVIY